MWIPTRPPQNHAVRSTRAVLSGLPEGRAGAIATVIKMRALTREAVRDPSQAIREHALSIIGAGPPVDQVRALQGWVQRFIRYVRDPPDVELVQTPQYTLQQEAGDCDDQATLLAALLTSVGHPVRFVALGLNGGPLSHVLVQVKLGNQWVAAETIKPKPLGWLPGGVTSHYVLEV